MNSATFQIVKVTNLVDIPSGGFPDHVCYFVTSTQKYYIYRNNLKEEIFFSITGLYEPIINSGTTTQYWRGDKTWQTLNTTAVIEGTNLYFTEGRVRSTLLTGLNISGGSISSTDSVLAAFGKIQNQINAIASPMIYQGVWNANTNSPTLTSSVGTKGHVYRVNTAGTTNIDGTNDWKVGDFIVFNGTTWDKWDSTDAVTSVNGYFGNVVLTKADVDLGNVPNVDATNPANIIQTANYRFVTDTEKIYWNSKQDALGYVPENVANKATTMTGNTTSNVKYLTSKAVYDWGTSTFIPLNTAIVGATKTKITYDSKGLVVAGADATTADIADSLNKRYVTDANLIVINNTSNTNTGDETQASIKTKLGAANTTQDGYLTSIDWNIFNNKQNALGYTPANKAGDTFTGDIFATNLSGNNTGDETLTSIKTKLGQSSSTFDGWLSSIDWNTFNNKQNALSGGTTNRITKWTSPTAIGISQIADDGTSLAIGASLNATVQLGISTNKATGFRSVGASTGIYGATITGNAGVGVQGQASGGTGVLGTATGTANPNIGVEGQATGVSTENIGGKFTATSAATNYSLQLVDGTQTVGGGKFLRDTGNGKANWFNITLNDISGVHTGTGTTNYITKWTGTTSQGDSIIFDNGTNIGIGTAAPAAKFHIINTPSIGGTTLANSSILIGSTVAGLGLDLNEIVAIGSNLFIGTGSSHYVSLRTTNLERLIITAAGDIGIGTSTPSAKLHINGDVKIDTISNAAINTDKFLVVDGSTIKYRTGAQLLSDIGGQGTINLTTTGNNGAATFISGTLNVPNYTLAGLGGVTSTRQLTINGTTYDLSADRIWSVGTVTNVAALTLGTTGTDLSSTVATGTTTPVITLNVPTASATARGVLSAADWATFNSKIGGLGTTNYIPKWSASNTLANSSIHDNSGNIGIGTTTASHKLQVSGSFKVDTVGIVYSLANAPEAWYRLATSSASNRGGIKLTYSTIGVNQTPVTYVIKAYKSSTTAGTLILEKYGTSIYIKAVRLVEDEVTAGVYHIEGLFVTSTTDLVFQTFVEKTLGYENLWSVNLNQLSVSTSTATPIRQNNFVKFSGGISSPSFQIQNNVTDNLWEFRDGSLSSQPGILNLIGSSGNGIMSWEDNTTNSKVGIGLTTSVNPAAKLHINNIGNFDSFLVEDSTNPDSTPFVIDSTGNVGIGLATPTTLGRLVVQGNGANGLVLNTDSGTATNSTRLFFRQSDGNDVSIFNVSGNLRFAFNGTTNNTSGDNKFIMTAAGSLLINATSPTIAPVAPLTAYATGTTSAEEVARFSAYDVNNPGTLLDAYMSVRNGTSTDSEFIPQLRGLQASTSALAGLDLISLVPDATTNTNAAFLIRALNTSGGTIVNRPSFEIRNGANVIMGVNYDITNANNYIGFGHNSPTAKVHVRSGLSQTGLRLDKSSTSIQAFEFLNSGSGNELNGYSDTNNAKPLIISNTTDSNNTAYTVGSSHILFNILGQRALTILDTLNIGIGTNTPSTKLHINSTTSGAFRLVDTTQGAGKFLTCDANGAASWANVPGASVATTNKVAIWDGSGNLNYDNSFTYISSIRNLSLENGNDAVSLSPGGLSALNTTSLAAISISTWSNTAATSSLLQLNRYRNSGANYLSGDALGKIVLGNSSTDSAMIYAVATQNESGGYASNLFLKTGGATAANLTLISDNSVRISNAYTLPITDGAANQVLKTDGSGNISWATVAGGSSTSTVQQQVKAAVAINKGQAVYVSSADGTNMVVSKASNATEATSSKVLGLMGATVAVNGITDVITQGLLAGLDTSTAGTEGDSVWLGTDGNLLYGLANKPVAPAHMVFIGIVTRKNAINGEIFIKPQNGFELDEIHDALITNKTALDVLTYDETTSLWKNKPSISYGLNYALSLQNVLL